MSVDADSFRSALGRFASGVTVVTARDHHGTDHGMAVSAFCSVSLQPARVLICVGHDASMFDVLDRATHFAVNVLSDRQEALSRRFAAERSDRFDGVSCTRSAGGLALLQGALAHVECVVVERHRSGDHTVMIGEVERSTVAAEDMLPLIYFRGTYTSLAREQP